MIIDRSKPGGSDMAIAPLALSDPGDDVGIDQVIHSSTSRPKSCRRLRSMPSSGAETSSALRPVALLPPKRSRNIARVSDSRLGSESAVTTLRSILLANVHLQADDAPDEAEILSSAGARPVLDPNRSFAANFCCDAQNLGAASRSRSAPSSSAVASERLAVAIANHR